MDIAEASGLDFVHSTGGTGQFYFPEIAGSGCGLFDYDGDGDLDVYAVQARPLGPGWRNEDGEDGRNRLFRNDLVRSAEGRGIPRFTDVTDEAGVGDTGYGMGCAAGDYDNDGDVDLYVTNYGPNVLYRNNGDGTFSDVTDDVVSGGDTWSTSASFVDYDRDGDLDLFVANYVEFHVAENKVCHSRSSRRDYCGPAAFDPVPDFLFRNEGADGGWTFTNVTEASGVAAAFGSGLGVVCADFDGDDWPDIYVANDGNANQLWINQRDGRFVNTALVSGAAYNGEGQTEAGMGVCADDFDLDGDNDIVLAHLVGEHNTLLVNTGGGVFEDRTYEYALGNMSLPVTAFGVAWLDVDGDGFLDLLFANGAVKIAEEYAHLDYPYPYPNQLLRNGGPPRFVFEDASERGGPDLAVPEVSRGAAFGDVDNDGDTDVLVSNSNGPLRLLRNDAGDAAAWLTMRLVGARSTRDAIGAVVEWTSPGGWRHERRVHADGSYCSVNDRRVRFGMGRIEGPQEVTVRWPSGLKERFRVDPATPGRPSETGRLLYPVLVEGTGERSP